MVCSTFCLKIEELDIKLVQQISYFCLYCWNGARFAFILKMILMTTMRNILGVNALIRSRFVDHIYSTVKCYSSKFCTGKVVYRNEYKTRAGLKYFWEGIWNWFFRKTGQTNNMKLKKKKKISQNDEHMMQAFSKLIKYDVMNSKNLFHIPCILFLL